MSLNQAVSAKHFLWPFCGCIKLPVLSLIQPFRQMACFNSSSQKDRISLDDWLSKISSNYPYMVGSSVRLLVKYSSCSLAHAKSAVVACRNAPKNYTCVCFASSQKNTGDTVMSGGKRFLHYVYVKKEESFRIPCHVPIPDLFSCKMRFGSSSTAGAYKSPSCNLLLLHHGTVPSTKIPRESVLGVRLSKVFH